MGEGVIKTVKGQIRIFEYTSKQNKLYRIAFYENTRYFVRIQNEKRGTFKACINSKYKTYVSYKGEFDIVNDLLII